MDNDDLPIGRLPSRRHPVRIGIRAAVGLATLLCLALTAGASRAQPPAPTNVVVVELFTSEGCSSCPPADALLTRLTVGSVDAGVTIVALGEHVDYWDRLGWRDPFSSASFSRRQSEYARALGLDDIYTPQMVVDGQFHAVGNDAEAVRAAIVKAARAQKTILSVEATLDRAHRVVDVVVRGNASSLQRSAEVLLAVTQHGLVTEVRRGENQGRTLGHSAVVRQLRSVGEIAAKQLVVDTTAKLAWSDEWKPENVSVVALLQDKRTRRIVGAGSSMLK